MARSQNPNVKIILALGGWTDSSGDKYSRLVNDAEKRANFVTKVTEMLETRNFDGLSLEWQYPVCWQSDCTTGNKKDKQGFTSLVKQLREAFEPKGLILAAGLSGYTEIAKEAYDIKSLAKYLDMANIMTYDYRGYWDSVTGHHSPLLNPPNSDKNTYNAVKINQFKTCLNTMSL